MTAGQSDLWGVIAFFTLAGLCVGVAIGVGLLKLRGHYCNAGWRRLPESVKGDDNGALLDISDVSDITGDSQETVLYMAPVKAGSVMGRGKPISGSSSPKAKAEGVHTRSMTLSGQATK